MGVSAQVSVREPQEVPGIYRKDGSVCPSVYEEPKKDLGFTGKMGVPAQVPMRESQEVPGIFRKDGSV
jgi:hypothetical protein